MKVFGEFEFEERSLQLRRGGSTVSINGQCLDLLVMMLERAGQLITREQIRQGLWPDSNVNFEHSLDVLVNRLRIVLGDDRKNPRYIQTVPKQGYRFVEQVRSGSGGYKLSTSAGRIRTFGRYAAVAVLAALIALLFAHTRYQKFVPVQGAPERDGAKRISQHLSSFPAGIDRG
jgi:DNA-binding winged helix-turn-helix (wHTH) protein